MTDRSKRLQTALSRRERKARSRRLWEALRNYFAIALSLFAVVVSIFTALSTANWQNEAAAIEAVRKYNELAITNPNLAIPGEGGIDVLTSSDHGKHYQELDKAKQQYSWYASYSLFTSQTIYDLKIKNGTGSSTDDRWSRLASRLAKNARPYIDWQVAYYADDPTQRGLCQVFEEDFRSFVEKELGEDDLCEASS